MRVTPSCDTLYSVTICNRPSVQADPVVAYTGENYVVVWSDAWFTGAYYWIIASCVDTAGTVMDTGYCIGAEAMCSELRPDIAFDGERCLVIWFNYDEPYGVYGRFVDELGMPEDTVFTISTTLASYNVDPSVVFAGDRYLVAWADVRSGNSDLDIVAQFVSTEGELIGAPVVIATGPSNQIQPAAGYDGSVLLVTWCDDPVAIFGQELHPDGTLLGGNFRISDDMPYSRSHPAVHASAQNFLVVWSETRGGESDIFGNIDVAAPVEEDGPHPTVWQRATIFNDRLELPFDGAHRIYDVGGRDVTGLPMSSGIYFVEFGDRWLQKIIKVR
ncbi:MAG: hypothetical protein JSV98_00205 [candidate division WOR-3 bacterium]|nr:MAG: hypothetical protein JSV98_00205 [candidate division WOR-3 bacterium]